jgi:tetrapyrrole methylase family protein/MazG family protein
MTVDQLLTEIETRFGARPGAGLQLLTASRLVDRPFDPGLGVLLLPDGHSAPETALAGRQAHNLTGAEMLRALYPGAHPVHALDSGADSTIGDITDDALASAAHWVPPLAALDNVASPHALPWLVARLRAPDGCPWDREQDHLSLRKFLLEETYEVYDALERGSTPELAEELGDLLLQIVLHAQYAAEAKVFDLTDVYRNIVTKIVRRHPHVFGDVVADSAAEVIRNWEQIKAGERDVARAKNGSSPESGTVTAKPSDVPEAFAGLSRSLPALAYAQEMQERAASLGYDWPSIDGVLEKVTEEAAELAAATDEAHRREEFGDLLMVLVNLGRKSGIDAESALRAANVKFATRFAHVERQADQRGVELRDLSFDELDELWDNAKAATAPAAHTAATAGGNR